MRTLDKENFKKRFTDYYPFLCRIAQGYLAQTDECEDLVQEVFISAWDKGKAGLPEKEFVSYMVAAVKNNCITLLRKQSYNVISLDDASIASASLDVLDETDGPESPPEEKLERILSVLPPKCKEIFLMSKLHGMKYREIAEKMSLSEKTIENQMGKAIRLIREQVASGRFLLILLLLISWIKNK